MAQVCANCGSSQTQTEVDGYRCLECRALTTYRGTIKKPAGA